MAWVNVGNIKGDTGDDGAAISVYKDSAHGVIYFFGEETEISLALSEIKGDTGATGPKGDTGDSGSVTLDSALNTSSTNAIQNSPVATAIQDLQNSIGTITSVQQSNLTLLGS